MRYEKTRAFDIDDSHACNASQIKTGFNMNKRDELAQKYFDQYRNPMKSPEKLIGITQVDEHFKAGWDAHASIIKAGQIIHENLGIASLDLMLQQEEIKELKEEITRLKKIK